MGGGREPMIIESQIVAMRGRDPQNPSDRTPGNPNLVQTLEPNSEGISNTITTVQKDNMVLELGYIEKGTGNHQSNVVYSEDGLSPTICASYGVKQPPTMHIEVKQATKEGSIPCEVGGGGRPELSVIQNTQRKSAREWTDMSNTDDGEYP